MVPYLKVLKVSKTWSSLFLSFYIEPPPTRIVFFHWNTVPPEICWEKGGEEIWKEHRLYSLFQFANNTPSQIKEKLWIYTHSYVKIQSVHKVSCTLKFNWNDSQKKWFKLPGKSTWNQEEMFDFPNANLKDEITLKYLTNYFPIRCSFSVCLFLCFWCGGVWPFFLT